MAEPVLENNEIKRRAIRRLIVAVVLVLVAVGILTYLSYYKPAKVVTKPVAEALPPPPPPLVTGPEPQAVEPAQTAQPLPEPPSVSTKPLPPPGSGPNKASPEPQKTLVKTAPEKLAPQAAPQPPTAAPIGYVVQFGVFSNPQNALQLVERLKQLGIAAQTETRVQLPTYKTKTEAEAALVKMKEKGVSATLIAR